ncbi:MAG: hypothetical protein ACOYBX_04880 [Mycobacterium sp.]
MQRNLCAAALALGPALLSAALLPAGPAWADDTAVPPGPLPAESAAPTQRIVPPDVVGSLGNALAQSGSEKVGLFGLPDISANGGDLLLAQNAAPAAPGSGQLAGIYPLNAFQSNYLLPQYVTPALPGQGVAAPGIGPDADDPGTGRIAFLKRLHDMYAAGELKGSLLGQLPLDAWDPVTDGTAGPIPPAGPPPAVSIPN